MEKISKKKLKIGIDIDNVISDTLTAFVSIFNQAFGTSVRYEELNDFYYLEKYAGVEEGKAKEFIYTSFEREEFSLTIRPYEEAKRVVQDWDKRGYSLHYVTARPDFLRQATEKWLRLHGFLVPAATLDLFDTKSKINDIEYKKETVRRFGINIFIEDHREIASAMKIPVLLLDRPWNQGKLPANVRRVADWKEIEKIVASYDSKGRSKNFRPV